jgi:hypothetical protein
MKESHRGKDPKDRKSHKSHRHKHSKEYSRDDKHRHKSKRDSHKSDKRKKKKHDKDHKKDKHSGSHRKHDDSSSYSDSSVSSDKQQNSTIVSNPPVCSTILNPITEDDYFNKSQEFRVWLHEYKHPAFEAMTSKEAHHIFTDLFIVQYNTGSLSSYYYTGEFPSDLKHSALHTQHRWNIRLNPVERDQVQSVADSVDSQTRKF